MYLCFFCFSVLGGCSAWAIVTRCLLNAVVYHKLQPNTYRTTLYFIYCSNISSTMDSDIKNTLNRIVGSLEDLRLKMYIKAAIDMKRNTPYFQSDRQCLSIISLYLQHELPLKWWKTYPHLFDNLLLLGDRYALAAVLDLPWCYPRLDPRHTLFKGQSQGSVHQLDVSLWSTSIKRRIHCCLS